MRASDIDRMLKRVDAEPDGSYRIVASKALRSRSPGMRLLNQRIV